MQGDKDNAVVVPFSDDETEKEREELFGEDKPDASPEERVTRKRRQQDRITRLLNEGKQSKEETARLKEEQASLKGELAELRNRLMQPVYAPPANDVKDPYEKALDAVYEKQGEAFTAAQAEIKAGTFTPERQKHYERVAREVESEKARIHSERAVAQVRQQTRQDSAQQNWVQKYPEVYSNPRAYQYAEASFRRKQALLDPGQIPSVDMVDEAMNEAMVQFKLGAKKGPSASDRARLSGVPSAGGGGSGQSAEIQLTPAMKRMAIAAYSELPEAEAIKKWANTTGKRLREKKVI